MKWFDGEVNSLKNTLIPYTLHGINDRIYDEVVRKEDLFYYLIIRCGVMPYTNVHTFTEFKTDGNSIIYPLPKSQIKEIRLGWKPPYVFGDNTTILVNSGAFTPEFTGSLEVDRRYKEYRKHISGNNLKIDTTNIDSNRKVYIEEVIGTEEGLGDLVVNDEGSPVLDEQGNEQYKIEIKSTGKNLLNFRTVNWEGNAHNISPSVLSENSVYIKTDNAIAGWRRIWFFVQGTPNTHYLLKAENVVVNAGSAEIYITKEAFSGWDPDRVIGTEKNGYIAKNRTDETGLMRLELWLTGEAESEVDILYDKVMLIEGDSDIEFEPYKENVTTLISPKKIFANEKLSWNSAREKYEVVPVFTEVEPIKDGLITWLDGRDGKYDNFIWKDRTDNGNNLDLTNLKDYVEWDGYGYIIKTGFENLSSSTITANCPEGYTLTVNFEYNAYEENSMNIFNGTYSIGNEDKMLIGYKNGSKDHFGNQFTYGIYNCSYVIDANSTKLYIDNKIVNKESDEEFVYSPDITFSLGNIADINKSQIKIHSIKMYNRALNETELTHNYNYEKGIQTGISGVPELQFTRDGLVAWYDAADGIDNKQLTNKVSDNYHMALMGDNMVIEGGQLLVNGTNNYGRVKGLLGGEVKYIEMVYTRLQSKSWEVVLSASTASNGWQLEMSANNNGVSLCAKHGGGTEHLGGFSQDIGKETWVAINVLDNKMFEIYVDGVKVKEGRLTQLTPPTQEFLFFATGSSIQYPAKVKFNQSKIYNRSLTSYEIEANYNYYLNSKKHSRNTKSAPISTKTDKKATILIQENSHVFTSMQSAITLDIPYKEIRALIKPKDVIATVPPDSDLVTLDWTPVTGAQGYKILLNGNEFSTATTNHWEHREEIKGFLSVVAFNDVTESKESDSVYVLSVPNETFISYIKNEYDNGYKFEIHFPDKSEMESAYKVYYKVDDRKEQFDTIPKSDTIGTVIKHIISIPVILDRIQIRVVSVNETGENTVVPPTILYITETPIWTYKNDTKTALTSWVNRFENVTKYVARISVNDVSQGEETIDVDGINIGEKVTYNYPLGENDTLKISIAAVMGDIYHIYSEEVVISKALDKTLAPPSDFKYRRIADDKVEFTWYDDYDCEEGFEFTYSISNSEPKTIFIPSTTISATGRRYSHTFTFEEHGFINAKVRMRWELSTSEYSKEATIYYLPASGLPPAYMRREVVDGHVKLSWEGQQYVNKYELHKTIGPKTEIISLTDNSYEFDIDYNYSNREYNSFIPDNAWTIKKYSTERYTPNSKGKHWITGLSPLETVKKPANTTINPAWGNYFIAHGETYVYLDENVSLELSVNMDDFGCVFVNDEKIVDGTGNNTFTANFIKGWNRLEILVYQGTGGFNMSLGRALTTYYQIKKIASEYVLDPLKVELSIVTKFLNEVISEPSTPMIFYPQYSKSDIESTIITKTSLVENVNANIYTRVASEFEIDTKSTSVATIAYSIIEKIRTKYLTTEALIESSISGKDLETVYRLDTILINTNSRQSEYALDTISIKDVLLDYLVHTTIYTKAQREYLLYTEINKVRIMTIGDSITAGHPGHWAETMTGDERSQYQYWLNRRLKGQYEIINKGYGSDTTDRMLERFNKDVLGYNATYCIIQGGTNDLYWAMAEADGDQAALDRKIQVMKENIMEMVKRCWDNDIIPIVGTLIPRTGAVGIYKKALYDYNKWIIEYCSTNDNIHFVDFFNAGKDAFPPTPLEDPTNPGALNPIYDGDAIYDEYGNLIKQGRGIHPSIEGYKIMGEAIPLNLFRTQAEGLKLYIDEDCTIEEKYDDQDKLNPFYLLTVDNITRGKVKHIVRYVKNIGSAQVLFAAFASKEHSVEVSFIDEDGSKKKYTNALLHPSRVAKIKIEFNILNDDTTSTAKLHLASRKITTN